MSSRQKEEIDMKVVDKSAGGNVNLSQAAGSGLALYGRVAAIGLLLGALTMLGVGIWFAVHQNNCSAQAKAIILEVTCNRLDRDGNRSCKLQVTYTVGGVTYPKTGEPAIFVTADGSESWAVGEVITICYNPNNPGSVMLKPDDTQWLGIVLIVIGVLLTLALSILVYKVWTNNQTAASFGAFEAIGGIAGRGGGGYRTNYNGGGAGGGGLLGLLL